MAETKDIPQMTYEEMRSEHERVHRVIQGVSNGEQIMIPPDAHSYYGRREELKNEMQERFPERYQQDQARIQADIPLGIRNPTQMLDEDRESIKTIQRGQWISEGDGLTETRKQIGKSEQGFHPGFEVSSGGGEGPTYWGKAYPSVDAAAAEVNSMAKRWEAGQQVVPNADQLYAYNILEYDKRTPVEQEKLNDRLQQRSGELVREGVVTVGTSAIVVAALEIRAAERAIEGIGPTLQAARTGIVEGMNGIDALPASQHGAARNYYAGKAAGFEEVRSSLESSWPSAGIPARIDVGSEMKSGVAAGQERSAGRSVSASFA